MPEVPESLARLAIIWIGVIASLGVLFIAGMIGIGFRQDAAKTADFLRDVLREGNAHRVVTVFFVIIAFVILGAINRLSDAVVTALSSIAAFALGGVRRSESGTRQGS